MITRSFDYQTLEKNMAPHSSDWDGWEPECLVSDTDNILLRDGNDFAFFEKVKEGLYRGHYFFESRGREALSKARSFLSHLFSEYSVRVVMGWTPSKEKGALWMNRQLGFKEYDRFTLLGKETVAVMLSKEEFK